MEALRDVAVAPQYSQHFAYDGVTVDARCADSADLAWLAEFLSPAFRVGGDGVANVTVTLVRDDRWYCECVQRGPRPGCDAVATFALDRGLVRLPLVLPAAAERILYDEQHRAVYIVDAQRSAVTVLSESRPYAGRLALMKVVREFAMTSAWTPKTLVLHAAVLAVRDRGIIIAGPKHAGKTSLLIHCLQAAGARLVSNDRAIVDLGAPVPTVRGMPTIVSIRAHTWTLFPHVAERLRRCAFEVQLSMREAQERGVGAGGTNPAVGAASLSPAQLCRLLGVDMVGEVRACVLLFPCITPTADTFRVRELSAAEAVPRLTDALFGAALRHETSDVFRVAGAGPKFGADTARRLWNTTTGRTRAFVCEMGPGAYRSDDGAGVVGHVLGAAASPPGFSQRAARRAGTPRSAPTNERRRKT